MDAGTPQSHVHEYYEDNELEYVHDVGITLADSVIGLAFEPEKDKGPVTNSSDDIKSTRNPHKSKDSEGFSEIVNEKRKKWQEKKAAEQAAKEGISPEDIRKDNDKEEKRRSMARAVKAEKQASVNPFAALESHKDTVLAKRLRKRERNGDVAQEASTPVPVMKKPGKKAKKPKKTPKIADSMPTSATHGTKVEKREDEKEAISSAEKGRQVVPQYPGVALGILIFLLAWMLPSGTLVAKNLLILCATALIFIPSEWWAEIRDMEEAKKNLGKLMRQAGIPSWEKSEKKVE